MASLGEDYPKEQARVRELLIEYRNLGVQGAFGAALIEQELKRADQAAISGDLVEIMRCYDNLKRIE